MQTEFSAGCGEYRFFNMFSTRCRKESEGKKMSVEYCAYPFLKEESNLCDYEIATDRLASMLSVARHHIRHIPQEDLLQLMEMIYHANGSIRDNCAIRDIELQKLNILYARYSMHMDQTCLMADIQDASYLHVLRAEPKQSYALCIGTAGRENGWKPVLIQVSWTCFLTPFSCCACMKINMTVFWKGNL